MVDEIVVSERVCRELVLFCCGLTGDGGAVQCGVALDADVKAALPRCDAGLPSGALVAVVKGVAVFIDAAARRKSAPADGR
jgi:hypothetical protein